MSGLISTVPVSPPPGVKSVGSNSGSAVTQPLVVAASLPLGQVPVPTVDVPPSALSVTLPLKPPGRVTGCPLSLSSWKVPSHGLAKLFDAPVVLALPERAIGPGSLTGPAEVSG